ncbi:MAG: tetratricopeptide repeat protein [Polaromonas sp.]|nr:tetratricopeptide repeat protein [Polaromonas sp.]
MDVYTLASRAQLLHQLGDTTGAIEVQQALMDHHPGFAAGHFNLGFMLQQAQRDAEAVTVFRKAVALQPGLDRAWYGLGLSLIRLGRLEGEGGAVAALEQNTALQPFSPHGWYQLARVRAKLGQTAQAEAIALQLQTFEPRVAAQLHLELRRGPGQGACAGTPLKCDGPSAATMAGTKAPVWN